MKRKTFNLIMLSIFTFITLGLNVFGQKNAAPVKGLVPDIPNPSPDYYCTWQTQQYFTSAGGSALQRANLIEANILGNDMHQGWANFYPKVRKDLFFVMDDSWDIPLSGDAKGYFGSLILSKERFPSFAKVGVSNKDALKNLTAAIEQKGWKALGGWVCAQEADSFINGKSQREYWIERARWASYAGFAY